VGRTDRLTARQGATTAFATILGTFAFTPALCFGRRIGPREDKNETCPYRRNHGHFGFRRVGGVGERASRSQPEPLPKPGGRGAAGMGMAGRSRPQYTRRYVCYPHRRPAWAWGPAAMPGPKDQRSA